MLADHERKVSWDLSSRTRSAFNGMSDTLSQPIPHGQNSRCLYAVSVRNSTSESPRASQLGVQRVQVNYATFQA